MVSTLQKQFYKASGNSFTKPTRKLAKLIQDKSQRVRQERVNYSVFQFSILDSLLEICTLIFIKPFQSVIDVAVLCTVHPVDQRIVEYVTLGVQYFGLLPEKAPQLNSTQRIYFIHIFRKHVSKILIFWIFTRLAFIVSNCKY